MFTKSKPARPRGAVERALTAVATVLVLAGCAADMGDVIVPVSPHQAAAGESALARLPPTRIRIASVTDARGVAGPAGRIGERKTLGEISMGEVEITPPPIELLKVMLTSELEQAGHDVVDTDADVTVTSRLETFGLTTPVTLTYWDVTIDAAATLQAERVGGTAFESSYSANCVERTYVWPSQDIIARMVTQCVGELAGALRNDTRLAAFLGA